MKNFLEVPLYVLIRFLLFLRYRIRVKGGEKLTKAALSKPGGILFLANHPAEIDPLILLAALWYPFKPHPVAIDYLFRKPIIRTLLDFVGAFAVPNFDFSSNSYKRKEIERTYQRIAEALDRKENLLLYPAGSLKNGAEEIIGGTSGVTQILEMRPDSNVVLIRTTGLWGSSFSRAPTGKTPDLMKAFLNGFKILLRNAIFFAPRRTVTIEVAPAPEDFPWKGSRLELNRYLEKWYNKEGPEPLNLVSFSHFRKEFPTIRERPKEEKVSLEAVGQEIKERVIEEIAKLTRAPLSQITPESNLAQDLGLDSLDMAQLVVSLKEQFGIQSLQSTDIKTVASVMVFAAKLRKSREDENGEQKLAIVWEKRERAPSRILS